MADEIKVRWKAEGPYWESRCGRFEIEPLYMGRCTPQSRRLRDKLTGARHDYDTVREAKAQALSIRLWETLHSTRFNVEVHEFRQRDALYALVRNTLADAPEPLVESAVLRYCAVTAEQAMAILGLALSLRLLRSKVVVTNAEV